MATKRKQTIEELESILNKSDARKICINPDGLVTTINDKQVFESRAASSGNVPGFDMLPYVFLYRTAKRFDLGAKKYSKFNYRKGLKDKAFILDRLNHAFSHLKLAMDLIEAGIPFGDDNLGAVACNIAMAMEYEQNNDLMK